MKKVAVIIMIIVLVFTMLCGCSGGSSQRGDVSWQEKVDTIYG